MIDLVEVETISIQSTGQGSMQSSHPVQISSIIECIMFAEPTIASTGHASMHFLQPIHSSSIIETFCSLIVGPYSISTFLIFFFKIVLRFLSVFSPPGTHLS